MDQMRGRGVMAADKDRETHGALVAAGAPKLQRGRPRKRGPTKVPVTIRLDIDLLEELKSGGQGWQTRLNNAVREWVFSGKVDEENK
jgi:uncharacterized protein (DUF4415 family)